MDPSSVNDPFAEFDEQRTFIRPDPGGLGGTPRSSASREPSTNTAIEVPVPVPAHGLNPLVALADPLLLLVPQLRTTRQVDDVVALRNSLAQGIRDFAARAASAGVAAERVMAARYVLCTMIDEAAADTPWGGSGLWAQHSLLAMFHNEVFGGEKVFQLMARLAQQPGANRDLLELIYAALVLGFEGRYRVLDNGPAQLAAVRDRLAQILKQQRGDHPAALAQHWQGHPVQRRAALSWLPLAATAALAALVLVAVHLGFSYSLGERSDPVYSQIQSLRLAPPVQVVVQPAPKPRLAQFLEADIKAGLVAVRDEVDRSVVTVRGDGLFEAGSAMLVPQREALMTRIAEALSNVPGSVLITGHTDNQAIRSARFPSNFHLSEERARSVAQLLAANKVDPARLSTAGRADSEPVASNDTPANRAKNRRVEITLRIGRGPEATGAAKPVNKP
jgi:type VI secretion system protein ImpK